MKQVVEYAAAKAEIDAWLEFRKVMPSQLDNYADSINILIEGIQYGALTLKDNAFTQKLLFPVGEETKVESLTYKPRINGIMLEPHLKGTAAGDGNARILAVLACLTSEPKQILKSLDPQDKRIADSIVVFFL
jgi:hypothetical protein